MANFQFISLEPESRIYKHDKTVENKISAGTPPPTPLNKGIPRAMILAYVKTLPILIPLHQFRHFPCKWAQRWALGMQTKLRI